VTLTPELECKKLGFGAQGFTGPYQPDLPVY